MNALQRLNQWSLTHHPKWLVVPRVALGVSLHLKGISFIRDSDILQQMLSSTAINEYTMWLAHVIPWLHLLGGFMIVIGLYTRLASLLQIPILLGAVFLVNVPGSAFAGTSDLIFSVIVLVFLVFFLIEGSGPISVDRLRKTKAL